jgi:hypothetical protein
VPAAPVIPTGPQSSNRCRLLLLGLWVCGQRPCVVHIPTGGGARGRLGTLRELQDVSKIGRREGPATLEHQILQDLIEFRLSTRSACGPACPDEASCRMFLCARCRSQVLVCRRCDRGQIYCVGTCAQEGRRDRQREARRRYQATPRGRGHACRTKSPLPCSTATRDGSWSGQGWRRRSLARKGCRPNAAVQQTATSAPALPSLRAPGFPISAPISPSSSTPSSEDAPYPRRRPAA